MNRLSACIVSAWLPAAFAASASADPGAGYGAHMWDGGGWMGWFVGPLMMVVTLAAVVAVVVVMVRWLSASGHPQSSHQPPAAPARTPLDILEERYARGEIDQEEFEQRRSVLRG